MEEAKLDPSKIKEFIHKDFDENALPCLQEFIKIPNISPSYDLEWETNGLAEKAANLILDWIKCQDLEGISITLHKDMGKTHTILCEVRGSTETSDKHTVFMYAHLDKMPPLDPALWAPGLHPYIPLIKDDKLFGRGSSDDGYGPFACVLAIKALQKLGVPHARIVILFETAEESGSIDLPYYLEKFAAQIGTPEIIACIDSGVGDYNHFWVTSSLRGIMNVVIHVRMLNEGVHSGDGGGIIPETFRIFRILLSRLDDPKTGEVVKEFQVEIPEKRREQAAKGAILMGDSIHSKFPFVAGSTHMSKTADLVELELNKSWKANLSITGAGGLPEPLIAGNVLRDYTTLKLSMRLPPSLDPQEAFESLKKLLLTDIPYGAKVTLESPTLGAGWACPVAKPWLEASLNNASKAFFGEEHGCQYYGEGGSIPFMGLLAKKYPEAEFIVTGVLGDGTNAHGLNEMLPLTYTKNVICCMSMLLADHCKEKGF